MGDAPAENARGFSTLKARLGILPFPEGFNRDEPGRA
jgi:hypothetical protein